MKKNELNLIKAIAFSFHRTTNLNKDDLFQEAAIAYLKASKTYNPEKAKFITHIYNTIKNHLINYSKKENRYKSTFLNNYSYEYPVSYRPFFEFFDSLSFSSQEIARIVLNNKNVILMDNPRQMRTFIKEKLFEAGYSTIEVKKNIKKLKKELKTTSSNV